VHLHARAVGRIHRLSFVGFEFAAVRQTRLSRQSLADRLSFPRISPGEVAPQSGRVAIAARALSPGPLRSGRAERVTAPRRWHAAARLGRPRSVICPTGWPAARGGDHPYVDGALALSFTHSTPGDLARKEEHEPLSGFFVPPQRLGARILVPSFCRGSRQDPGPGRAFLAAADLHLLRTSVSPAIQFLPRKRSV
jgi:hypothetical protein